VSKEREKDNPVFDEQTLGKLLEAAFVMQEHNHERQKLELNLELNREFQLAEKQQLKSTDQPAPPPSDSTSGSTAGDVHLQALAPIVETQRQIQARHLDLENALALVAERTASITKAAGAAVVLLRGDRVIYRAAVGTGTLEVGTAVSIDKTLSCPCLRTGEVVRCADVNAEFLLDSQECHQRGIAALIAVPIYHDGQIAGALEIYFAKANPIAEPQVHASQLMAGIVAEALARDAQLTMKKSLAAERASMLDALEKLQPNLAAFAESSLTQDFKEDLKEDFKNDLHREPGKDPGQEQIKDRTKDRLREDRCREDRAAPPTLPSAILAANTQCRKCGHELMEAEQFCGKCGSPRSGDYESPSMQTKVAALWLMQQVNPENSATPPNGAGIARAAAAPQGRAPFETAKTEGAAAKNNAAAHNDEVREPLSPPGTQPSTESSFALSDLALSELGLPDMKKFFDEHAALHASSRQTLDDVDDDEIDNSEIKGDEKGDDRREAAARADALHARLSQHRSFLDTIAADSALQSRPAQNASIGENSFPEDWLHGTNTNEDATVAEPKLQLNQEHAEATGEGDPAVTAGERPDTLPTWTSAANAREFLQQLAGAKGKHSVARFWNKRRGDLYLGVAVVLIACVIRWGLWSNHSVSASHAPATESSQHSAASSSSPSPAPDADLTLFDKMLISLGLAEAPAAPEYKGNPDTQVWVDTQSALYYCPGADLYGKTPKGKYTSQRDALLDQFESASRKPCD
jgi:GAF domain-containing protein